MEPPTASAETGSDSPLRPSSLQLNDLSGCRNTLSVSQVTGAALILTAWYVQFQGGSFIEFKPLSYALNLTIALSILYYFVSSWNVEESLVIELRALRWGLNWIEILLRTFAFGLLLYITLPTQGASWRFQTNPEQLPLLLGALFSVYLLWDFVVYLGSRGITNEVRRSAFRAQIRKAFLLSDSSGLFASVLIYLGLWTSKSATPGDQLKGEILGVIVILACLLYVVPVLIFGLKVFGMYFRRLFHRDQLR